jgi:hypothetical protein
MDGLPTFRIAGNTPKSLLTGYASFESATIQEHCPVGKRDNHVTTLSGWQALLVKAEGTTMLKCVQRARMYLLIVAICPSCCAISGCIESVWELTSDSILPKWITLPSGLTRADVKVQEVAMEPTRRGVDVKVILYNIKYKKLEEVRGNSFDLSGRYFIVVVDGVPEVIGLKTQKNKLGDDLAYFFVVDDPALKTKLLNENEKKLLQDIGFDNPAMRKKLLDESRGLISDH